MSLLCFGTTAITVLQTTVASTGELVNPNLFYFDQRKRFDLRRRLSTILFMVTKKSCESEKTKEKGQKTWIFSAKNVRLLGFKQEVYLGCNGSGG